MCAVLMFHPPDLRMSVHHGTHERRSRAGHSADEDERHVAVVWINLLVVRADHVFLEKKERMLGISSRSWWPMSIMVIYI